MSFYSRNELSKLGFKSIGENVLVSTKCSIYSPNEIVLGNNVRIDDFTILSGSIRIGNNVHISAFCGLYARNGIEIMDYSGLSPRSTIFSAMDDFSGEFLINPTVDNHLTNVVGGKVVMEKFTQVGAHSVVFPNVKIKEGSVTGAFSLVLKDLEGWSIYAGIPVKKIKNRSKACLNKLNNIPEV
ncbi:MAG: galactoside O-acetyltransferase [Flavobacteriales bacterium]|nr:galactoside O-acetyltransferase [Flavobacteriales bacterium]|tara:strand:+ start:12774 stop:13325 length:552 start_codon:yes stop_codon:yes gene_type:complete